MTVITQSAPPSTPAEAKALTQLADSLPPLDRHMIRIYAEHVHVECEAREVGALHRARCARAKQLALLGVATQSAGDRQGDAHLPGSAEDIERVLGNYRLKMLEMMSRP